jgi:hypothetical protein
MKMKTIRTSRRKIIIYAQVKDVNGDLWDIREARNTKHGFELYFGRPSNDHGAACYGGMPSLIATEALRDFWHVNRTVGHGFIYDLPAGRSTLKRVRKRLGFHFLDDVKEFWMDHIEELGALRPGEFAARYGVDVFVALAWRLKLLGQRARPIGWWRTPDTLEILLSRMTLIKAGRKLGIGITHTKRLRDRAKQEQHLVDRKEVLVANTEEQYSL